MAQRRCSTIGISYLLYQHVNMISLSVTLFQFRTKISANLCRTLTEGSVMQIPQYRLSILGDKHQMYVQNVGRMA